MQSIYDNWYRFFMSEQKQGFPVQSRDPGRLLPAPVSEVAKGHSQKDTASTSTSIPSQMPAELKEQMEYCLPTIWPPSCWAGWSNNDTPATVAHYSCPPSMIEESQ